MLFPLSQFIRRFTFYPMSIFLARQQFALTVDLLRLKVEVKGKGGVVPQILLIERKSARKKY
jgi:hypothetical protein